MMSFKVKSQLLSVLVVILISCGVEAIAQDDLLKELEASEPDKTIYTEATFKGTRAVNGHSIETKRKGELEFLISHRFGRLNSGAYEFWGLDQAFIRLGFEYGINDRLGVGIGRNSYNKIYDGYVKYKLIRQQSGAKNVPVTITAFGSTAIQSVPRSVDDPTIVFNDRLAYTAQLHIGRKFSPALSLQVSPTIIHTNRVDQQTMKNDQYALGLAGRYKLTRSLSLNAEYYYRIDPLEQTPYYNSLAFGLDIETGGHVFQLIVSNTQGMVERTIINETAGDFLAGDIHFGFNITRTFQLAK
ncbi:MAG: DUF5777 family beta-barrel protein [Cyclobacteriaceae bacterium]|nr:DUF5777 family beta-barrel protein [Cyclobacteriaceae bacterium]